MRNMLILVLVIAKALAVEEAATITGIIDGDTVAVSLDAGGQSHVRLLWIDTPELHDNQHDKAMPEGIEAKLVLQSIVPAGSRVKLYSPMDTLARDPYGRLLAVVVLGGQSAQELMIRGGWTVYWRKYGDAPEPWNSRFNDAQHQAKSAGAAIWRSAPQWMAEKANERFVPQR